MSVTPQGDNTSAPTEMPVTPPDDTTSAPTKMAVSIEMPVVKIASMDTTTIILGTGSNNSYQNKVWKLFANL
jgi:hypothetical protein